MPPLCKVNKELTLEIEKWLISLTVEDMKKNDFLREKVFNWI